MRLGSTTLLLITNYISTYVSTQTLVNFLASVSSCNLNFTI